MTKFAVIDVANLFQRARHTAQGDAFTKAGLAVHTCFKSLAKLNREAGVDHMVFATEGRSWRYSEHPGYKAKRHLLRETQSPREKEEDDILKTAMDDLIAFLAEKTRCTVLHSPGVEGDDWIARWTQLHPQDEHVLLTSDSDFVQLIAPNVTIYDGVAQRWLRPEGVFNTDNEPLVFSVNPKDGKVKVTDTVKAETAKWAKALKASIKAAKGKEADITKLMRDERAKERPDDNRLRALTINLTAAEAETAKLQQELDAGFQWPFQDDWFRHALFVKIVRGDVGDDIFSSFPGVRYHGSKNKVGIREAWDDRNAQGFDWNNFMLQRWSKLISIDKDGNKVTEEVRVIDEFRRNEGLIDLTMQPEHIKDLMDEVIVQAVQKEPVRAVGMNFLKFCGKLDLPALAAEATYHAAYLNRGYASS